MPGSSPRPPPSSSNANAVASTSRLPLDEYVLRKYDSRHFPFASSSSLSPRSIDTQHIANRRRSDVGVPNGARRVDGRNEVGSNGARWKGKGKGKARAVSPSPFPPSSSPSLPPRTPPQRAENESRRPQNQGPAFDRLSPPPPPSPPQAPALRWVRPITQAELDARGVEVPVDLQNEVLVVDRRDPEPVPMQWANRRDPEPMERANRIHQTPASDSRSDMHHVRRGEVEVEAAGRGDGDYDRQRHRRAEGSVERRAEGSGGNEGVVLEMTMVGGGVFDVAYVLPITVGRRTQQTFSVQVDTGSSDLWIASSSCNTAPCNQVPRRYNPAQTGSTDTGQSFTIDYLQGHVDGPVVWDRLNVGGYEVENQAIAAGANILAEPLSSEFAGILGLALPLNSVIAQALPPVTTNDPDGAAWASNLFGITPYANAPMSRFIGMLLERPGSDRIPSLLGIGRHPSLVDSRVRSTALGGTGGEHGAVEYSTLVSERTGTLFWKTSVRAVTVYVDGEERDVDLGRGVMGSVFPSAVLDSGVPLILASGRIANAVWGAIGVSPSADGYYYIPCTMPLNMTITLDDRMPISLHPLDLTAPPESSNSPGSTSADAMCVGLIQSADAHLGHPNAIGDMILGVPFLRNVYSVMAYANPNADGTFERPWPEGATGEEVQDPSDNSTTVPRTANVMPRLGLMSMTDPTIALEEFRTVRVLNRPITNSTNVGGNSGSSGSKSGGGSGKGLSVGIIVLIALVGFFAACFILFGIRWWLIRRKYGKGGLRSAPGSGRNTPLPWFAGLGGGGGGGNGGSERGGNESSIALSTDPGRESDEVKLAKMLGAGSLGGLGGGGYVAAKVLGNEREKEIEKERVRTTYPPRPSESRTLVAERTRGKGGENEGKRMSEESVYSVGSAQGVEGRFVPVASTSTSALVHANSKSVSTFRNSEKEDRDRRDTAAMAWPADTATLASKASRARMREDNGERARNDSSTLGNGRYDDEEAPPMPSSTPLLLARERSPRRLSGEGLRTSGVGEDTLSTSVDLYYASASPLAPLPSQSQLPFSHRQSQSQSTRHSRVGSHQHHRPAPSFPPSRKGRSHDSTTTFASPLPSSTLGDFGEVSGAYGHRSSRSGPSAAATWNTDSMASFYASPTPRQSGPLAVGDFVPPIPVRMSEGGGEVRGVLSVSAGGKGRRVSRDEDGSEWVGVAL